MRSIFELRKEMLTFLLQLKRQEEKLCRKNCFTYTPQLLVKPIKKYLIHRIGPRNFFVEICANTNCQHYLKNIEAFAVYWTYCQKIKNLSWRFQFLYNFRIHQHKKYWAYLRNWIDNTVVVRIQEILLYRKVFASIGRVQKMVSQYNFKIKIQPSIQLLENFENNPTNQTQSLIWTLKTKLLKLCPLFQRDNWNTMWKERAELPVSRNYFGKTLHCSSTSFLRKLLPQVMTESAVNLLNSNKVRQLRQNSTSSSSALRNTNTLNSLKLKWKKILAFFTKTNFLFYFF